MCYPVCGPMSVGFYCRLLMVEFVYEDEVSVDLLLNTFKLHLQVVKDQ